MLDPRKISLKRDAFEGEMILTEIQNLYNYVENKKTDQVVGIRCNVVMPSYGYERLAVKLPKEATVDTGLVGKSVSFQNFAAHVYAFQNKIGYVAAASAVVLAD